jgi:hypothetical protein
LYRQAGRGEDFRQQHFEAKADKLFEIEIYYCVLLEGAKRNDPRQFPRRFF